MLSLGIYMTCNYLVMNNGKAFSVAALRHFFVRDVDTITIIVPNSQRGANVKYTKYLRIWFDAVTLLLTEHLIRLSAFQSLSRC